MPPHMYALVRIVPGHHVGVGGNTTISVWCLMCLSCVFGWVVDVILVNNVKKWLYDTPCFTV